MSAIEIERPLKMPENYDFSSRKVNWTSYRKDYLLRTDAVWEKEKLKSYFYAIYKGSRIHYKGYEYYKILFEHWIERIEDKDLKLDVYESLPSKDEAYGRAMPWSDGRPFSFDMASSMFRPLRTTNMVGDRTKDGTFLCMLKFHKFMRCNEKSQVKMTEANFITGNITEYRCFEELNELFDTCIHYHMKILFEMYYFRVYNDYFKPMSQHRTSRKPDPFYTPEEAQKLYY